MKQLIFPLLLVLFSASQTLQAEIFKWADKDGKIHYSATPPKEPQKDVENIGDKIKANIGKVQPAANYKAPLIEKDKTDESEEPEKKSTNKKIEDPYKGDRSPARIEYCNKLKSNIQTLETNLSRKIAKEGDIEYRREQVTEQLEKDKNNLSKNCIGI